MSEITPFIFKGQYTVRTVEIDGETWWVVLDACKAMGIEDARQVANRIKEGYRCLAPVADSRGQMRNTWLVNEAGLMQLIMRSDVPAAAEFQEWVYEEVLPQIRRTGRYQLEALDPELQRIVDLTFQMQRTREEQRRMHVVQLEQGKELLQLTGQMAEVRDEMREARGDLDVARSELSLVRDMVPHMASGEGHSVKDVAHACGVKFREMHTWLREVAGITYRDLQKGGIRPYAPWINNGWAIEKYEARPNGSGADWVTYFTDDGLVEVKRLVHTTMGVTGG